MFLIVKLFPFRCVCFLITATKIRRLFLISKFFLTFLILFFFSFNHSYIFRLFRFAGVLPFSGDRVFRWCPDPGPGPGPGPGRVSCFPQSYTHTYTRTHTRAHGDFQTIIFRPLRNFQTDRDFQFLSPYRNFWNTNGNFQTAKA